MNTEWNSRETLPKDGTQIRILWGNGKEDIGHFERLDYSKWHVEECTKSEHPDIYEAGGEWVTDFGEGDNCDFDPVGWLPLTANQRMHAEERDRVRSCDRSRGCVVAKHSSPPSAPFAPSVQLEKEVNEFVGSLSKGELSELADLCNRVTGAPPDPLAGVRRMWKQYHPQ